MIQIFKFMWALWVLKSELWKFPLCFTTHLFHPIIYFFGILFWLSQESRGRGVEMDRLCLHWFLASRLFFFILRSRNASPERPWCLKSPLIAFTQIHSFFSYELPFFCCPVAVFYLSKFQIVSPWILLNCSIYFPRPPPPFGPMLRHKLLFWIVCSAQGSPSHSATFSDQPVFFCWSRSPPSPSPNVGDAGSWTHSFSQFIFEPTNSLP